MPASAGPRVDAKVLQSAPAGAGVVDSVHFTHGRTTRSDRARVALRRALATNVLMYRSGSSRNAHALQAELPCQAIHPVEDALPIVRAGQSTHGPPKVITAEPPDALR